MNKYVKSIFIAACFTFVGLLASERENRVLFEAIHRGAIDDVQRALETGADANARHDQGFPALTYAVYSGNEAIVEMLLRHGADVRMHDPAHFGQTALIVAAGGSSAMMVQTLLYYHAEIDERDDSGMTALLHAALHANAAVVPVLLHAGAHVDIHGYQGRTALMAAVRSGRDDIVGMLLEQSCVDVEARDDDGLTALMWAAQGGYNASAHVLLGHGAHIDARDSHGMTALMHAVRTLNPATVGFLLEHGAAVNVRNDQNQTALLVALSSWQYHDEYGRVFEIATALLNRGVDVQVADKNGKTAFDYIHEDADFVHLFHEHENHH